MFVPNDELFNQLVTNLSDYMLKMGISSLRKKNRYDVYNQWLADTNISFPIDYVPALLDYIEDVFNLGDAFICKNIR